MVHLPYSGGGSGITSNPLWLYELYHELLVLSRLSGGFNAWSFFDYLPHRPFQERNRWKNARVYPSPLLNWLIMGQNYHLIHHLWPSIPWYKYQGAYIATRPLLDQKGCEQSLGLLRGKNFWDFLYDVFLGIRFHHRGVDSHSE
jgi:beta-carotene hydroxylase